MNRLAWMSTARIGRAGGWLAGNGNLRLRPLHLGGVVALLNWAKVEERVLFLGLDREPRWSPLLSAQAHLNFVIRADRNSRLDALPAKDDIENPVHIRLQFGSE